MAEDKEKVEVLVDELAEFCKDADEANAVNEVIYERYSLKTEIEALEAKLSGLDSTLKTFCGKHKIDSIKTPIGTLAYMNGTSTSLDKATLIDQMSKAGLIPDKIDKIIATATKTKPTSYVQFRKAKE